MHASANGHLSMVNRLLDCKEIDVNFHNKVSGIVNLSQPQPFYIYINSPSSTLKNKKKVDVFFY